MNPEAGQSAVCHSASGNMMSLGGGTETAILTTAVSREKRKPEFKGQRVCGGRGGPAGGCSSGNTSVRMHGQTRVMQKRESGEILLDHPCHPPKGQTGSGRPLRAGSALPAGPWTRILG